MLNLLKSLHVEESGQDIVEYVLIAALVSLAAITILPTIGTKLLNYWTKISTALS